MCCFELTNFVISKFEQFSATFSQLSIVCWVLLCCVRCCFLLLSSLLLCSGFLFWLGAALSGVDWLLLCSFRFAVRISQMKTRPKSQFKSEVLSTWEQRDEQSNRPPSFDAYHLNLIAILHCCIWLFWLCQKYFKYCRAMDLLYQISKIFFNQTCLYSFNYSSRIPKYFLFFRIRPMHFCVTIYIN